MSAPSLAGRNPALFFGFLTILMLLCGAAVRTQTWTALGPPGGDVRVLAADPSRPGRVFLGTGDGHIFGSKDSGGHWALLGRASSQLDAVITAVVVDPRDGDVLFASSWTRDGATGGGVFRSDDGGRTWRASGLAGKAVRALATAYLGPGIPAQDISAQNTVGQSTRVQTILRHNTLIAGTLDGIYRSRDAGLSWERISPEGNTELRNIDAVAIDPGDPQTIYAGTFHLPWKTTDGGGTWRPVHEGMIDDSDVMSLLIDRSNARLIYASACSGIYRSDDGASVWRKIQGIPYSARRTYAIAQDPNNPERVYAATSKGLWKTADGGASWQRTTPESWAVNSVVVTAGESGRVLIGTQDFGVLASDDQGDHFQVANTGFDHREILTVASDPNRPGRMLAILGDGPARILATEDKGKTWVPLGPGLSAQRALQAYAAPDGTWWVSLAHGGLMRYDAQRSEWRGAGVLSGSGPNHARAVACAACRAAGQTTGSPPLLNEIVAEMAFSSEGWLAATSDGLLVSADQGATWMPKPVGTLKLLPMVSVRASWDGRRIGLVSLKGAAFSIDSGVSWTWPNLPFEAGGPIALEPGPSDDKTWIAIARNGLYISRDGGGSWEPPGAGLPLIPVRSFAVSREMLVAAMQAGGLYVSRDSGRTWSRVSGRLADSTFATVIPSREPGLILAAFATEGLFALDAGQSAPGGVRPAIQISGQQPR